MFVPSVKPLAKYYDPYGARKHDYKPLNTYLAAKYVQIRVDCSYDLSLMYTVVCCRCQVRRRTVALCAELRDRARAALSAPLLLSPRLWSHVHPTYTTATKTYWTIILNIAMLSLSALWVGFNTIKLVIVRLN